MTLSTFKKIVVFATVLITVVTGMAFATAPYIGSAYLMLMKGTGDSYMVLTRDVALPLLRVGFADPHLRPVDGGWATLVWLLLFSGPWVGAGWALRAREIEASLGRWVAVLSVFGTGVSAVFVIVVAGLVVSVACM